VFRYWSQALSDKTTALQDLRNQLTAGMGLTPAIAAQRFSGQTLECYHQTLRNLDETAILSTAMERVLRDMKSMLDAAPHPGRTRARFSAKSYRAVIHQLQNDEPLVFRPEEGVQLVVCGPPTQRNSLFGSAAPARPFALSARQLLAAIDERMSRVQSALTHIESDLVQASGLLQNTKSILEKVRSLQPAVRGAGSVSGVFGVRAVFEELLPLAEQAYGAASKVGIRDATGILRTSAALALRQAQSALSLVELAMDYHRRIPPGLGARPGGEPLVANDTPTQKLMALSVEADALARRARTEAVTEDIARLRGEITQLLLPAESSPPAPAPPLLHPPPRSRTATC
jgi:hypothetical protein